MSLAPACMRIEKTMPMCCLAPAPSPGAGVSSSASARTLPMGSDTHQLQNDAMVAAAAAGAAAVAMTAGCRCHGDGGGGDDAMVAAAVAAGAAAAAARLSVCLACPWMAMGVAGCRCRGSKPSAPRRALAGVATSGVGKIWRSTATVASRPRAKASAGRRRLLPLRLRVPGSCGLACPGGGGPSSEMSSPGHS